MNSKLRCLIIDDELPGLALVKGWCGQMSFVEVAGCYDNPEKLLNELNHLMFDVCIMDINMPGINGIDLARMLNNKPVIFISAHPEYAADAFDIEAFDFIRKPAGKERLEKALLKVFQYSEKSAPKRQNFSCNTQHGKSIVNMDDILYICTSPIDKRDKICLLKSGEQLVLKNITFNKLQRLLPASAFCKVNKREMICRTLVKSLNGEQIQLKSTPYKQMPLNLNLGEIYRTAFIKWMDPV